MLKSKSNNIPVARIISGVAYLISAFLLPWWLVIIAGIFFLFYLDHFYEFIFAGLILDTLYGGIISFENFEFLFTFLTTISTIVLINFKKRLFI